MLNVGIFQAWKANLNELGTLEVKIPMMVSSVQSLPLIYSAKLGCLILEIPIVNSSSSLILFLPHNVSSSVPTEMAFDRNPYHRPTDETYKDITTNLDNVIADLHRPTARTRVKVFMPR